MLSAVAKTFELDDAALAAEELADGILAGMTLRKNSVGILFCDSAMDHGALLEELSGRLDIEIIGCTTVAALDHMDGFHEFGCTLAVLTGDDCVFATACSEPFDRENARAAISGTYRAVLDQMENAPALMFILARGQNGIMSDLYPEILEEVAPGVPLFGGIPSSSGGDSRTVFHGGQACGDRMVVLALGGAVRPVFSCRSIALDTVQQKRTVTKAEDNIIYRVGDETFVEYMESLHMPIDHTGGEEKTDSFLSRPLLIEDVEQGISFVRVIHDLDREGGFVVANGKVKEGSILSVGMLRRDDIRESARLCMEEMKEKIVRNQAESCAYSLILCASCIGRYLILAPDHSAEGKQALAALQGAKNLIGFYGWGEFCPMENKEGRRINKAHDETISLCAL